MIKQLLNNYIYLFLIMNFIKNKLYKEQLYSRQVGTLGESCMKQLSNLHVLVLHLDTTGFETVKCLVLMGIHTIYLYDPRIPNTTHIGLNIALQKNNHTSIAEQTKKYVDTLNPFVNVVVVTDYMDILTHKNINVCIQTNLYKSLDISTFCHHHNINYILGYQYDLLGYLFNDFNCHTIHNINGENPSLVYVKHITKKNNTLQLKLMSQDIDCSRIQFVQPFLEKIYTITKDIQHNDRLYIEYDEDIEPITLSSKHNILIREYKEKIPIQHHSLQEHIIQQTYMPDVVGHTSSLYTSDKCVQLFHTHIQHSSSESTKNITQRKFPIIGSILGAIIAQEVVKTTGIYTPIHQQYIIDYSDLLQHTETHPHTQIRPHTNKTMPFNNPYHHICSVLPDFIIQKLKNLRVFLVGCGALGCEYLKYFHQLDMSTNKDSTIVVTDMDHIELSNLNRQFLFRENNIGKSKSVIAAKSIQTLHSHTHSTMYINAVDKELSSQTNDYFNYKFWDSKDIIVNALDNIKTRQFVDEKCVLHNKPLFESGTLGTKCNVQVIIPHKTITYSETHDPPQKEIPVCTIKHFPYTIDHCISWALDIFHYHFTIVMDTLDKVCNTDTYTTTFDNMSNINNKYRLLIHTVYLYHTIQSKKKLQQPIILKYLVLLLYTYYNKDITELQQKHPKDSELEDGTLFWSGNKLYPNTLDMNKKDKIYTWIETMYDMCVQSVPCLDKIPFTAQTHKRIDGYIHTLQSTELTIESVLFTYIRSYYNQHNTNISIPFQPELDVESADNKIKILYAYIHTIKHKPKSKPRKYIKHERPRTIIHTQTFDKDDSIHKHIDTVSYMSNYRANNYGIQPISIAECRIIAGNIIPALSTTTTLVTGLSIMEMLTYIYNTYKPTSVEQNHPYISYTDHFINTGVNTYIQSEPMEQTLVQSGFNSRYGCNVVTKPHDFSVWDKILIHNQKNNVDTIYDIIQLLHHTYNIEVSMLSIKNKIIYTNDMDINVCKDMLVDVYPKHEYIQLDSTDFEGDALVVHPNIVLYCE